MPLGGRRTTSGNNWTLQLGAVRAVSSGRDPQVSRDSGTWNGEERAVGAPPARPPMAAVLPGGPERAVGLSTTLGSARPPLTPAGLCLRVPASPGAHLSVHRPSGLRVPSLLTREICIFIPSLF